MASYAQLTKDEFRLLTWTRPRLSTMTIQPESLERHCPLDNGRLEPCATKSKADLSDMGTLQALPLEITDSILSLLDLQSLTGFRAISWRSRDLIDGLPQYKAIIQHAPNALRALLSTNMAAHFTAQDLFGALCTQACFGCGQFGPFLDSLSCRRCCLTCVIHSDRLLSITVSAAKREFRLTSKEIRALPTFLSLPGQYSKSERKYRRRFSLVRVHSVISSRAEQPVSPPSRPRWDGHGQNAYRFMPMVRVPALDRKAGTLDWGVSCQGCRFGPRDESRGYCDWNTLYSAAGYLEHFQKCEASQAGKRVASEFISPVAEDQSRLDSRFLGFLSNLRS